MKTKTEMQTALMTVAAMLDTDDVTVSLEANYLGQIVENRCHVKICWMAVRGKAHLIEQGRAFRRALREAGFVMNKASVTHSWWGGRPADYYYCFTVGI